MVKRVINAPIRTSSLQPGRITLTLSDAESLMNAELVIEIAFRGALDPGQPAAINQAIVLAIVRNAIVAQIQAISQTHGPIPEEPQ